ncbi:MAG: ribosomal protein L29 [Cenarchaeum symbiont of Oopsacas minuta]|nr:ribosomal protein L29 [Cenarchaeum symbiont of Oopsacas minuta]
MAKLRTKAIRAMSAEDIKDKVQHLRADMTKMRMSSKNGTLRKESGKMRPLRHNIARLLTRLGEIEKK